MTLLERNQEIGDEIIIEVVYVPRLVNLTPHVLRIMDDEGYVMEAFEACSPEEVVRVAKHSEVSGVISLEYDVPMYSVSFGQVENMPEEAPDTLYIVSSMALQAIREQYPDREDFIAPYDYVRDCEGNIIGCRSFCCL